MIFSIIYTFSYKSMSILIEINIFFYISISLYDSTTSTNLHSISAHVQYTQTESNRLKAKTIRVSSRIKDFRLTGSPFSGTRLTGSQVANKCAGRWKILTNRLDSSRFVFLKVDSTQRKSGRKVLQVCARNTIRHNKERITWTFLVLKASLMQH